MDKNIKILLIIILLLLLYDYIEYFCKNDYLIEGEEVDTIETTVPTVTTVPAVPIENTVPTVPTETTVSSGVNFLDKDINTFKYSNPSDDYSLDKINEEGYSGPITSYFDTIKSYFGGDSEGLNLLSNASNTELCNKQFPKDTNNYRYTINGETRNLKEECLSGMTYQKMACMLEDTDYMVNDAPISYYRYDPRKKKCVYNPPSYLTTRRYCNSYDNKTECLANKTNDDQTPHCSWVKSFRYYPNPNSDDIENCQNQNSKDTCINATDNKGRKRCSWKPNKTIKTKGLEDDNGTCFADPSKYLGGVSFENVKLDGNIDVTKDGDKNIINTSETNIYRYIQDGACMENCSTSSESECNNRLNCLWVNNSKVDVNNPSGGMCINNEILLEREYKEIYDQEKMCSHYEENESECNNASENGENDDAWHCKWKKFAGSCIENSSNTTDSSGTINTLSFDGRYYRQPNASACQTKFYQGLKDSIMNNSDSNVKDMYTNSDSRDKARLEYDYLVNNESVAEQICKNIRYSADEIQEVSGTGEIDQNIASNASFCQWKDPPPETCHYKSSTDLINPGNYYLNKDSQEVPLGKFNRRDPAYYYNSMFVPLCNHLNSETECGKADINCTWNASENKCRAKCIGVGSNVNRCGKTAEELKSRVRNKYKNSQNISSEDDIEKYLSEGLFDDYSHCTFNDDLNLCVLDSDYTSWKDGGVWSTEIPDTIINNN